MAIRPLVVAILWALVAGLVSGEGGGMAMRARVFADAESGIAFRYPYRYMMPDDYVAEFCRQPAAGEGRELRAQVEVRVFSGRADPLIDGEMPWAALTATGDRQVGAALVWQPMDYYRDPSGRPFAARDWAPPGIQAALGGGATQSVLVLRWNDRLAGVVVGGRLGDLGDNQGIIDSVEVMTAGKGPSGRSGGGSVRPMTWREAQCRRGLVADAAGMMVRPGRAKPLPWDKAWEVETEHYHLTGNRDPELLQRRAAYYEALHRAYAALYQPERLPPVKAEVHLFDAAEQFELGARQWIDPAFEARRDGSLIGGFFASRLLSLWMYEESGLLGGDAFSVEHVSAHESSHQFMHFACNGSSHIPTWINEGLAVYFEAGVIQRGEFVVRLPSERLERLREVYGQRKTTLRPLDWYMDHREAISADQYGEVFAMTHYWLFGSCRPSREQCRHRDCGLKRFRDYWQALRRGEDGGEAFDRIFFRDMVRAQGGRQAAIDAWSRALMEYVAKRLR